MSGQGGRLQVEILSNGPGPGGRVGVRPSEGGIERGDAADEAGSLVGGRAARVYGRRALFI